MISHVRPMQLETFIWEGEYLKKLSVPLSSGQSVQVGQDAAAKTILVEPPGQFPQPKPKTPVSLYKGEFAITAQMGLIRTLALVARTGPAPLRLCPLNLPSSLFGRKSKEDL